MIKCYECGGIFIDGKLGLFIMRLGYSSSMRVLPKTEWYIESRGIDLIVEKTKKCVKYAIRLQSQRRL